jgi:Peptidase propeptide and YPEB domain
VKNSTILTLVAALLGTLGLGTMVHWVNAAQTQAPLAIMPEPRNSHPSAQTSDGDGETKDDAKEQANEQKESSKLKALAKVTPQQAQQAAEVAQGGKSSRVKLENEDGNLVYAVVIGQKEVKVDAGNGRILYTESLNHEDNKAESSHPRSSIQVSEAPGGEGDGETHDDG